MSNRNKGGTMRKKKGRMGKNNKNKEKTVRKWKR